MSALDQLLALFGTNRTRLAWKWRRVQRWWERRTAQAANRTQVLGYQHQTCPACGHPADAGDRACGRCNEPLGGRVAHKLRRFGALVWPEGLPVVATVLVATLVAMFLVMLVWSHRIHPERGFGVTPHQLAFVKFGALTAEAGEGQWWRFGTSTLLHVDVLHLLFNAASLWTVASYLEEVLGKAKTIALYFALGIVASLVSYEYHVATSGFVYSAGASGAICGLIGVCLGFTLRRRNAARHLRGQYVGWAVWIGILALSSWRIDNAAHLGGFVPGLVIGLLVRRHRDTGGLARRVWFAAALAMTGLMIAMVVLAGTWPMPSFLLEL